MTIKASKPQEVGTYILTVTLTDTSQPTVTDSVMLQLNVLSKPLI